MRDAVVVFMRNGKVSKWSTHACCPMAGVQTCSPTLHTRVDEDINASVDAPKVVVMEERGF